MSVFPGLRGWNTFSIAVALNPAVAQLLNSVDLRNPVRTGTLAAGRFFPDGFLGK